MTDPRVAACVSDVVLPAFTEIAASSRMKRDFAIHVYDDAVDDALHATLISMLARDFAIGPVLLVESLDAAKRPAPFGGRYLAAPVFRVAGDDVLAYPVVMYQMQFDRGMHAFQHRYSALAEVPVDKLTRAMILNHVLNSFSFFQMHALSPTRPW